MITLSAVILAAGRRVVLSIAATARSPYVVMITSAHSATRKSTLSAIIAIPSTWAATTD